MSNRTPPPPGGKPLGLQAARRHKVGILWLQGFSVRDIAVKIQKDKELHGAEHTSYVTVHTDIQAIKADLKSLSLGELEVCRSRSIESLRLVINKAWIEIGKVRQERHIDAKGKVRIKMIYTSPSVIATLLSLISITDERIAKLEGTLAPTEITGKGGKDLVPKQPLIVQLAEGGVFVPPDGNGHRPDEIPAEG